MKNKFVTILVLVLVFGLGIISISDSDMEEISYNLPNFNIAGGGKRYLPEPKIVKPELSYETEIGTQVLISDKDYNSKKFKFVFRNVLPVEEYRLANFDNGESNFTSPLIHTGGEVLDLKQARTIIEEVLALSNNIEVSEGMILLGEETLITETLLGGSKYQGAIDKFKNYGIAQFRVETAEHTLSWLRYKRKDIYTNVMSLYIKEKDLKWNLINNVHFSVALMYQYYWLRVPNLASYVDTRLSRAALWKSEYNSPLGLGTVQKFVERVDDFYRMYTVASL